MDKAILYLSPSLEIARSLSLIAFVIFAGWPKSHLRRYFIAQLAYSVTLETMHLQGVAETTRLYHWAYYSLTFLILLAMIEITLAYLQAHPSPLLLFFVSLGIGASTFLFSYDGLAKPLHSYDRFMLIEATTLMFCGSAIGLTAGSLASKENRRIAISFSIFWICLGIFRYGFNLNLPQETWLRMNFIVPYGLACSEFLFLGWILRHRTIHGPHRRKAHYYLWPPPKHS